MLDFDLVQSALERLGATADAAESHGTLCALLIDNSGFATWLGHTLDELPDKGNVLATERSQLIEKTEMARSHVKRGDYRNPFRAHDMAAITNFAHFVIKKLGGFK